MPYVHLSLVLVTVNPFRVSADSAFTLKSLMLCYYKHINKNPWLILNLSIQDPFMSTRPVKYLCSSSFENQFLWQTFYIFSEHMRMY